jgi:RNA polymerase sigma-70 factor (ECF subfamily)
LADKAGKKQGEIWLNKLLAGDHEAFAKFVDKYKETVFVCCRTLGLNDSEIEDVASETFMAAYNGIRRYTGRAKLSTWLWGIAYRQGVNYLRRSRREGQIFEERDKQIARVGNIEVSTKLESTEQAELIWEAVGRLPSMWAMATVLFYREEKEVKEIAKIMRVRQNTVKTYLFRSRKRLKELLGSAAGEDIDVNQ